MMAATMSSSSPAAPSLWRSSYPTVNRRLIAIVFLLLQPWTVCSSSSSATSGLILRVRRVDGSMERIVVPEGTEPQSMTLEQLLSSLSNQNDEKIVSSKDVRLRIGDAVIDDLSKSISDLGLKNGSLITILATAAAKASASNSQQTSISSKSSSSSSRWDPFPDLAKDYAGALRQFKVQQQKSRGRSSYGDLAHLQANLHVVDPQPEGPLMRVYMCRKSAERFQANGIVASSSSKQPKGRSVQNRIGLLLGTIQRERKRPLQDRKARTSLSSLPSDQEYCHVAKVHAIWEPAQEPSSASYDASNLVDYHANPTTRRVLELAQILGLSPIGWIFTYSDEYRRRTETSAASTKGKQRRMTDGDDDDDEKVPVVLGPDVVTGAQLEMAKMKFLNNDRIEGKRFVTLAMDAVSGATEAFQLSDVSVQMVAEGLFDMQSTKDDDITTSGRFVKTQHAIVVDGQETHQLDTWLCLINTALLSHEGDYCSTAIANAATSPVTKKNKLTAKTKKSLRKALESSEDERLLELLADFSVLVALDQLLTRDEMQRLCQLVHKWVRGQKRGTRVDNNLQARLKSLLS